MSGSSGGSCRQARQSSERQFHIEADYFIDATGDGTVSAKAGVPFSVGNGNHETLGNSILYYTRREDHPVSFIAPDYAYDMSHIEKILGCAGRIIGVERSVFFSSCVMNTCALSGQAAGTLAAACLQAGKAPAEQLVSGESRPWGGVNAWITAPEDAEPWAELRWAAPACEIW